MQQLESAPRPETVQAQTRPQLPDIKTAYDLYKENKKQDKKGRRLLTVAELRPFYNAILKALTPDREK
jgi:hypothetical protein